MNYKSIEQFCWPFVLIVGRKITKIQDSEKKLFWRDHSFLSAIIVLPVTVLEWLPVDAPSWIYLVFVAVPSLIYIMFIKKWRLYLKSIRC